MTSETCTVERSATEALRHTSLTTPLGSSRADQIRNFIADRSFPCVGAKSALNKGRLDIECVGLMGQRQTTRALHALLLDYSSRHGDPGSVPVSFVAVFDDPPLEETTFERKLWQQLQALHDFDLHQGAEWASNVSDDPERHDFSFSVGGRAFFVVGLHPKASRLARRSPFTCLVFNFHDQFETLKASGKYTSMQDAIRARDVALQGSINPVLARFGEASEARQYSGRAVEANWACPFHSKAKSHA